MLSTSCIETTRRIGTLVYIEIFSRTFSFTGLVARQAMMCGMIPTSISRLMPKLRRLGFLLAQRARFHHVRQSDEHDRVLPFLISQLAAGFQISLVFKVPDRAADFDEDHIRIASWRPVRAVAISLRR